VARTEWFARVTADCPLVSPTLAAHLLDHTAADVDLVAVRNEHVTRGLPVELVRRTTFSSMAPDELDGPQREHVTLAMYEAPDRYRVRYVDVPPLMDHPELRLTLDYPEDYELLRRLFADDDDLTAEAAVARLLEDPELAEINRSQRQKAPRPSS
jgi:spore coat polysaccharide biosynthesis protein SpsF